ncbi:MAG: aldo/keto reductase [Phycisphaeraceae bacterium]|nr:aldo/keto reductase [Phycisphaeraceae bacterium]
MNKSPFGATGLEVTPLGIGATGSVEVITLLLDQGINLVDTAQCYGEHELFLGRTIAHRRDEFILVSKCGHHDVLPDGSMRSRAIGMDDIDQALELLKTDHLDVMLLHSYDQDLLIKGEAVEVLLKARQAGKIRFAGYSGDNESAAIAAAMDGLDVIETSINLADQHNIDDALPIAQRYGAGVIAKRPVANAAWGWLDQPDESFKKNKVAPYVRRLRAMNLDAIIPDMVDSPESWIALAVRFNLSVSGLHTSIISTSDPGHARLNLDIAAQGPLPDSVYEAIRQAFRSAASNSDEPWKGEN